MFRPAIVHHKFQFIILLTAVARCMCCTCRTRYIISDFSSLPSLSFYPRVVSQLIVLETHYYFHLLALNIYETLTRRNFCWDSNPSPCLNDSTLRWPNSCRRFWLATNLFSMSIANTVTEFCVGSVEFACGKTNRSLPYKPQ